MLEMIPTDLPDGALIFALGCVTLLLLFVFLSLLVLISVLRRGQTNISQAFQAIEQRVEALTTSLEGTGPMRYALAGLLALRKNKELTSQELKEELEGLLKDYRAIDGIVEELKLSLLTLDDQASGDSKADHRGEVQ